MVLSTELDGDILAQVVAAPAHWSPRYESREATEQLLKNKFRIFLAHIINLEPVGW